MATGQNLLNMMETLDLELQLQSGEADVVRGLTALNAAQDYFEVLAAQEKDFLGGSIGTVVTAASTESTTFPSTLLRVDRLQYIDPGDSLPAWDLIPIKRTGGHSWNLYWPINLTSTATSGRPKAYWTNGRNIYWDPLPDAVHTVRWYGFIHQTDITAAGTFLYDDALILPAATFAVKVLRTGVDDPTTDYDNLANALFPPIISALGGFNRDGADGYAYRHGHET